MRFSFRLSKKRVLVAMLALATLTSLLGSIVSDMLRMPATCAMAPVSDFVKASTSAFKSAMADREEPAMSAPEAAKLREEVKRWRSTAEICSRRGRYWWERCRAIQNTRSAYGASLNTCELIPARVIMGEALPYGQSQTVAQGTIHGVEKGMRVIDVFTDRSKALPDGNRMRAITGFPPVEGKPIAGCVLVGWVEAAGSFTARVRLVTDKRFKIEAWLQRKIDPASPRKIIGKTPDGPTEAILTRENNKLIKVTLRGDGERGLVTTDDIPKDHNVRSGDWMWTIGRSAKLPVQLRIGEVVNVTQSDKKPNFVSLRVAPAARLGTLQDIFIVRSLVSQLPPAKGGD
ncbi:MAG: rod shape-determining protein MreC [Phycisphaerae bacterium]|jgi:cell shape-determining protein MreC|nr:rod shape-determining protein MreC [Phycisphaerae bacterium]